MTPAPVVLSSTPRPSAWTGEWHELASDVDRSPSATRRRAGCCTGHPSAPRAARAGAAVAARVVAARPSLVVVDVSVEVTLLVRLLGVPVVVVAMQGDRDDRPHVAAYDAATALLAPWPRDAEVGGLDRRSAKTIRTGAFSRHDGRSSRLEHARGPPLRVRDVGRRARVGQAVDVVAGTERWRTYTWLVGTDATTKPMRDLGTCRRTPVLARAAAWCVTLAATVGGSEPGAHRSRTVPPSTCQWRVSSTASSRRRSCDTSSSVPR